MITYPVIASHSINENMPNMNMNMNVTIIVKVQERWDELVAIPFHLGMKIRCRHYFVGGPVVV